MNHTGKTREQLILELEEAQQMVATLQAALSAGADVYSDPEDRKTANSKAHELAPYPKPGRENEAALSDPEKRYRSFFDQSAEGIWLVEVDEPISIDLAEDKQIDLFYRYGHMADCNDAMAHMYGLASAEELQGAHLSDLLIPTDPHNIEYLRAFIRSGYKLTNAESHEIDTNGKVKFFSNNLIGIIEDGYLVRAWGTQRDITDAKSINEALRESEARNRALLQAVPDWMFRFRKDGTYLDFSGPMAIGLLSSPDQFLGKTVAQAHPDEFARPALERIQQTLDAGCLQNFEYTIVIDGQVRHFESRMAPSGEDEVVAIVRDITETKRAQEVMSGQQRILELIAMGTPLQETLTSLTRFVEKLSERTLCSILLLDEDEKTLRHGAAPSLPEAYTTAIDGVQIGPYVGSCGSAAYHNRVYIASDIEHDPNWAAYKDLALPHGLRACWSSPICSEVGKVLGTFALYYKEPSLPVERDYKLIELFTSLAGIAIERHLAEVKLRESEARFRTVAESTASAIFIHREGNLLYVNPATESITGYSRDELLKMNVLQLLHPDSIPTYQLRADQTKRNERSSVRADYKILHKNGQERWVDFTYGGHINMASVLSTLGTAYDITDRKHAEESLIAEKERLAVTLRSIGDGVIATDTAGRVVSVNRVAESLCGWRQEDALGRHLDEVFHIIHAKSRIRLESVFARALQTEQTVENQEPTLLLSRNGAERNVAGTTTPIYDKEGKVIGIVLVFRDLTDELKREEELLKTTKLESIALLAGGIAHDFNNLLTAIMGNISLAKQFIEQKNKAYLRLSDAELASWRARDLTQQLLTFASGGAPIKKTASVAPLVQEAVSFSLIGSNIKSELRVPDDLWLAEIDEGQINQVLNNFIMNARQAMPLGGTIQLSAENILVESGVSIQGVFLPPRRYVKITVKDPGVGIAEEDLHKIFDPYFTTKQQGSGLGLASAYSIIKNHGGYIFVESEPGDGTTFSVYLPASEKSPVAKSAAPERSHSGNGKILIMDDEPALRKMMGEILRHLGYQAEVSQDGEEAVAMYEKALIARAPYDAVILDLTVPGAMGGKEAAEHLHRLDKNVKCIVSSGYSHDPVMAEHLEHGFVAVIAKPYQIAQLSEVLTTVLGDVSEEN